MNNYSLESNPNLINKIGELKYTTNLGLRFYEQNFLNTLLHRINHWGMNTLITGYDIRGINEIYNRVIVKKPIDLTNETETFSLATHKGLF